MVRGGNLVKTIGPETNAITTTTPVMLLNQVEDLQKNSAEPHPFVEAKSTPLLSAAQEARAHQSSIGFEEVQEIDGDEESVVRSSGPSNAARPSAGSILKPTKAARVKEDIDRTDGMPRSESAALPLENSPQGKLVKAQLPAEPSRQEESKQTPIVTPQLMSYSRLEEQKAAVTDRERKKDEGADEWENFSGLNDTDGIQSDGDQDSDSDGFGELSD